MNHYVDTQHAAPAAETDRGKGGLGARLRSGFRAASRVDWSLWAFVPLAPLPVGLHRPSARIEG